MKTLLALLVVMATALTARMVGDTATDSALRRPVDPPAASASGLSGWVEGLPTGSAGQVVASAGTAVAVATLDAHGRFALPDLPDGGYVLEVSVPDFDTGPARAVTAPCARIRFRATPLPTDGFQYSWRADASEAGSEHGSKVVVPFRIETADGPVDVPVHSASLRLARELGQALRDDERAWSQEHAHRLLETLRALEFDRLPPSIWTLVDSHLPHDVQIVRRDGRRSVRLSTHAFTFAGTRLADLTQGGDRLPGRLSSNRLHHAVVRWATDEGRDRDAVEHILSSRHGTSLRVEDYAALTASTTREGAGRFQEFRPGERLAILQQFEELPPGMRHVPGLRYLVRRLDGTPHPTHPRAPAVSWPSREAGYIEFMESAFSGSTVEHAQRLILHEKAHFLWTRVLPEEVREAWIRIGRWEEDPGARSGWSTPLGTEFVSSHAHGINPDEDLAESIAWFVVDPAKLESRAPAKFAYLRDEIMSGRRYLSRIREDLLFLVENETPDYVSPGPVRRVDVTVQGAPMDDKLATVEIELDRHAEQQDARSALLRMVNEAGVIEDLRLSPVDTGGAAREAGHVLRGSLRLSRHAKGGYWFPVQIITTDAVGNERFQRGTDFGWRMYVDSPLEDVEPPGYVPGSLRLTLESGAVGGEAVRTVVATWKVREDTGMPSGGAACSTALALTGRSTDGGTNRSITSYGSYDPATGTCTTRTRISQHRSSGVYSLTHLAMRDLAGNKGSAYFTGEGGDEAARSLRIRSADSDERPPELDVNSLRIIAEPTNSERPDGETRVSIGYLARDDKSGLGQVSLQLRDPQGVEQNHYHYHENFHGDEFEGDPAAWRRYEVEILLPAGSPPGAWGLSSMRLQDKAGNEEGFDFSETLQFELIEL